MRVTVHIIWGAIAVSHYRAGLIDIAVKLAHAAYDFFSEHEAKAFVFGISEARKPDEWAVIENPADIRRIGMPLRSALIEAAKRGDVHAVKSLLEMGVHPDGADQQGFTALHHAARQGKAEVVEALVAANADVNLHTKDDQVTPLHLSAEGTSQGHTRAMNVLLNADAHTEAPDIHGNRPLHYAARRGNLEAVEGLLAAGAKASVMNNFSEFAHDVAAMQQEMTEQQRAADQHAHNPLAATLVVATASKLFQQMRHELDNDGENIAEGATIPVPKTKIADMKDASKALGVVFAIKTALQAAIEAEKQKQASISKMLKTPHAHPTPFNGSGH